METTQINFRIAKDLLDTLRQMASDRGIEYTDLIRDILSQNVTVDEQIDFFNCRVATPYSPIAEKILATKRLSKAEIKEKMINGKLFFDRQISVKSYVIQSRGSVPDMHIEKEHIPVDPITISVHCMTREDDLEDEIYERTVDSIRRQVDLQVYKTLMLGLDEYHKITIRAIPDDIAKHTRDALYLGISMVESHEFQAKTVLCHPYQARILHDIVSEYNETHDSKLILLKNTMCPKNTILVLPDLNYLGRMAILSDISRNQLDDPKDRKKGWIFSMDIALFISPYAAAMITVLEQGGPKHGQPPIAAEDSDPSCSTK